MGAHLVFADESGFQLIPNVVQTWAPQGQTPVHRHRQGKREKISVISGISVSPKRHHLSLYYLLFLDNIGQEEVCLFLQEVLRHLRGPVIVLVDNSSTHQRAPLQKLLDQNPRLHLEHFPSYAPELNPDEGVWSLAKRALANSCPANVDELMEDIIRSINSRFSQMSARQNKNSMQPCCPCGEKFRSSGSNFYRGSNRHQAPDFLDFRIGHGNAAIGPIRLPVQSA
jgi:transposase